MSSVPLCGERSVAAPETRIPLREAFKYLPLRGEGGPLAVDEVRDSPERPIIEDSLPFQGAAIDY